MFHSPGSIARQGKTEITPTRQAYSRTERVQRRGSKSPVSTSPLATSPSQLWMILWEYLCLRIMERDVVPPRPRSSTVT